MRRSKFLAGLLMALLASSLVLNRARPMAAASPPVGIYTYHGDNMRTGWNSHETVLTQANVSTRQFGHLWERAVDGQIYAQPLYVPDMKINGTDTRNVVFVATEHNSVYAFDADGGSDAPLWQVNLGPSVPNEIMGGCLDIEGPEHGITSTPVIDPASGTLYAVARTLANGQQHYALHALQIATGQELPGWPAAIQGSVTGDGGGNVGGKIMFDARIHHQRPGLLLLNGRVLIGFGAYCDDAIVRYHGWIFSFSASDPNQPPLIFNTTPDASEGPFAESAGGIWQAGYGLAADEFGHLYVQTGNGLFNADLGGRNVGNSVVRLNTDGGTLSFDPFPWNYFTPSNERDLDARDQDMGSGGVMVIPEQPPSATPHLLVGAGKDGVLRLLNRDYLGGFTGRTNHLAPDKAIQSIAIGPAFCGPAYWEGPDGPYIFSAGLGSYLQSFRLGTDANAGGRSKLTPAFTNESTFKYPPPTPAVSSDGRKAGTGIVWVLRRDKATLCAYNAENLSLLWQSGPAGTDDALGGKVVKFTVPIVANGKVYACMKTDGAHGHLVCYGLRAPA
jgi:outer membrane protein assembly factor BamB